MPLEWANRQSTILNWAVTNFGEVAKNPVERGLRLVEEALEVGQSSSVPKERVLALVERVYSRPVGDLAQEIGGTGMTLDALAELAGIDAQVEITKELIRVLALPKDLWQKKHAEKVEAGVANL